MRFGLQNVCTLALKRLFRSPFCRRRAPAALAMRHSACVPRARTCPPIGNRRLPPRRPSAAWLLACLASLRASLGCGLPYGRPCLLCPRCAASALACGFAASASFPLRRLVVAFSSSLSRSSGRLRRRLCGVACAPCALPARFPWRRPLSRLRCLSAPRWGAGRGCPRFARASRFRFGAFAPQRFWGCLAACGRRFSPRCRLGVGSLFARCVRVPRTMFLRKCEKCFPSRTSQTKYDLFCLIFSQFANRQELHFPL